MITVSEKIVNMKKAKWEPEFGKQNSFLYVHIVLHLNLFIFKSICR